MSDDRIQSINDMRMFLDWIEQHPELPQPFIGVANAYVSTKEELAEVTRQLGSVSKNADANFFYVRKDFGSVRYEINVAREVVCERVVVGKTYVDAVPAHEVDKIEWRCGDILKGAK